MAILNNESGIYAGNIVQGTAGAPIREGDFKRIYENFSNRIYGLKTFKVKKPSKR